MNIRNELKALIAINASTLKKVCEAIKEMKNKNISPTNLTNKLRRKTVKFEEVQDVLDVLGYHFEIVRDKE